MKTLDGLISKLWDHYSLVNPQAHKIHALLEAKGEKVVNDHIAFRTFNIPKVGMNALAKTFIDFGYKEKGSYVFTEKKLDAKHFEHPDIKYPLIFISELKVEEFSDKLQSLVKSLVKEVPDSITKSKNFPVSNLLWSPIRFEEYEMLRSESEYAAWLAAFGYCANHFTVLINELKNFNDIKSFNSFVKSEGFKLNDSGGEIKGSPAVFLEQSSTLADPVKVNFKDGPQTIPCCYYEFAIRYKMPDGKFYRGFVEKSADKIFESTNKK
jgi:hypothetical protein